MRAFLTYSVSISSGGRQPRPKRNEKATMLREQWAEPIGEPGPFECVFGAVKFSVKFDVVPGSCKNCSLKLTESLVSEILSVRKTDAAKQKYVGFVLDHVEPCVCSAHMGIKPENAGMEGVIPLMHDCFLKDIESVFYKRRLNYR